MKPEDLSQVAAVVTGAAGGLGAAMTEALTGRGFRGVRRDPSLSPEAAAEASSAPAAWSGPGQEAQWPGQGSGG